MITRLVIVLAAVLLLPGQAQDIGDFTRAPIEHEIDLVERPFVVRVVKGRIFDVQDRQASLVNVLFEIQGPATSRTIRRTTTDREGLVRINHVPPGEYRFKATLNGWQSVMGTIVVSKDAPKGREILIGMHVGT